MPKELGRARTFGSSKACHARHELGIKSGLSGDRAIGLEKIAPQPTYDPFPGAIGPCQLTFSRFALP